MESKLQAKPGTLKKSPRIIPLGDKILLTGPYMCVHFFIIHVFGIVGIVLMLQGLVCFSTIAFAFVLGYSTGICITTGAHRLWAHRAYKARTPLKIILAAGFQFTGQASLWHWTANHRIHHKFTDTPDDPHDSTRGFFYSHIGWLLTYDYSKFVEILDKVDISDLDNDKIVMFFHRNYFAFYWICVWFIPTFVPWYFWGEHLFQSFCVSGCFRLLLLVNFTFLVNSAAHLYGYKPYDSSIRPTENRLVSILALGEGWHNYHHVFPWDYKTSELGFYRWNLSTALIDFFAWIGWAYDLKTVDPEIVAKRRNRTGHSELQAASE